MAAGDPVLVATALSRSFGGVLAVKEVSFETQKGSITAIIGPNGAGKTTLFNLLTNLYPPDSGTVHLFGQPVRGRSPETIAALGLIRTFQASRVFQGLSVLDNVLVGAHLRVRSPLWRQALGLPGVRREERLLQERAEQLLEVVGLAGRRDDDAATLSVGGQKQLELARALIASPSILLLDEPAAGLNDAETAELGCLLAAIRAAGITLLVVEHNMSLVMSLADELIVLDMGRVIARGPASAIQSDPRVISAYLGQPADEGTG